MSTQNDSTRTFAASAACTQYRRVALGSDGTVSHADNTEAGIGIVQNDVSGASDPNGAVVRLPGTGSHLIAITASPVTAGDLLYAAADGYAAPTGTVALALLAGENTATNGTVIEAIPTFPS